MDSLTVTSLIIGGTIATLAVAWVLIAPVILFALHFEAKRRDRARRIGISLDDLDGVDTTRWLDREGRNGGKL